MRIHKTKGLRIHTVTPGFSCPIHLPATYMDLERSARENDCLCCRAFTRAWFHFNETKLAIAEHLSCRRRTLRELAEQHEQTQRELIAREQAARAEQAAAIGPIPGRNAP